MKVANGRRMQSRRTTPANEPAGASCIRLCHVFVVSLLVHCRKMMLVVRLRLMLRIMCSCNHRRVHQASDALSR